jgi:DNA-binding SARP family transcriptional activator
MPRVAMFLLGPPRIERDGVGVGFDTRKAVALLAFLALHPGPLRRDTLAAALWPDAAQARSALRRTLSALNAALGDSWLQSERDQVALPRGPELWVDVDDFERHLAAAGAHHHGDDEACEECRAALRAAADVFRGDFLEGFGLRDSAAFDDWQLAQAERLRRELGGALERLSRLEANAGDFPAAIAAAQRWLELDPLHEHAHRALMALYARSGQRSAAVQQYRECVRVLERELQVPPLEATTALYQAIVAGQGETVRRPSPGLAARANPAPPPVYHPPALAGRDAEWAALVRAYEGIAGDGHLLAIEGPTGIGKTRLADEMLAFVERNGAVTLRARCHEGETALAYAPFIALLRAALDVPGATSRLATVPQWLRAEAARLLPALSDQPPASASAALDASERLFAGVAHVLLAVCSGERPGSIFVDDLQWADQSSLDLFAYLARRLRGRPLCLLAAWRADEVVAGHALRPLVAELRRAGSATILPLAPLSREAVSALLRAAPMAGVLPAGVAEQLFVETEGLPFLVVEYLAMLGAAPAAGWALPEGARDLLRARLRRASAAGAQLLATAAVIGRSFDLRTLLAASGRSEDEVVEGLEELTGLGIVVEADGYDFSHGKLRDLVYAEMSLARRRLLHRRVAEALAAHAPRGADGAANDGVIAQHYRLAGHDAQAAEHFARAGRHAQRIRAIATALNHFEDALALGHPAPGPLHAAIGDLHTLEGRYDAALASYEAAALGDPAARAAVEAKIAEVHRRRGDWGLAESHLRAGLEALGAGDAGLRARLLADRSLTARQTGDTAVAQAMARDALALAERAGDTPALARINNLLGMLAKDEGDLAAAIEQLELSLALAERLDDREAQVAALNNQALARGAAGETVRALALAERALALCEAHGDRHRAAAIHNNIADLLYTAGRGEEAMERLKRAVAIFAEIGADANGPHPAIWQLSVW